MEVVLLEVMNIKIFDELLATLQYDVDVPLIPIDDLLEDLETKQFN